MLEFDLHVHTIFSECGIHTVLELIERARFLGMKGLAITDHGLTLGGRLNNPFFERFKSPYPEVNVLKGIECNLVDEKGTIDIPPKHLPFIEVVLLGIHPNTPKGMSSEKYTDMLVAAIHKNPCIDIITHPNDPSYPVNYGRLAEEAKKAGVALELNNSKILYSRSSVETTIELVETCRDTGCRMAVCSDTHAILELGTDEAVKPILEAASFPEDLIVNRNADRALQFVNGRRENKRLI